MKNNSFICEENCNHEDSNNHSVNKENQGIMNFQNCTLKIANIKINPSVQFRKEYIKTPNLSIPRSFESKKERENQQRSNPKIYFTKNQSFRSSSKNNKTNDDVTISSRFKI